MLLLLLCRALRLQQAWQRMGLQLVCLPGSSAGQQQQENASGSNFATSCSSSSSSSTGSCFSLLGLPDCFWQIAEGLLCPGALRLVLQGALGCLPWLLLHWCLQLWGWLQQCSCMNPSMGLNIIL
jgi:hypothetical protein